MMNGNADEFCLVEPLDSGIDDPDQHSGISRGIEGIVFAPVPPGETPHTPAPPLASLDTPRHAFAVNNSSAGGTTVPSVLADDKLWGPPTGARRPFQTKPRGGGGGGGGAEGATASAGAINTATSPPWAPDRASGAGGGGGGPRGGGRTAAGADGQPEPGGAGGGPATGKRLGSGLTATAAAAAAAEARSTPLPRRNRGNTSGINREGQFEGGKAGSGSGGGGSRIGGGMGRRQRSGPGNGRGGLSKKTLNIVTNLKSHNTGVRTREEMEDLEEEKRLAEEERRFKENLRQKGDDFDHTIRILLLGDSGVGKTSLMTRFSEDKFAPTMISTAGVDFKVQTLDIDGKRVRCQIWDTAGQERFHVITRAYYRGAHGIALAYDVADDDSFKNVNYWMANIQTHADRGHRMQKMILGNKVDIEERTISTKEGEDVAKEFGVRFFEVSAKNGYGVSNAFYMLAVDIVKSMETANRRGTDERRAARLFGGGAARLRSFASSKKPTFLAARKLSAVSWTGSGGGGSTTPGGGSSNGTKSGSVGSKGGGGGGVSGSGNGKETSADADRDERVGSQPGAGAGSGAGAGARAGVRAVSVDFGIDEVGVRAGATAMARSASDKCKVS